MTTNTADAWVAGLLLAALLAVAGADVRTRIVQARRQALPGANAPARMPLVAPPGGQKIAGSEVFQGAGSLVEMEGFGPLEYDERNPFRHALGSASALLIRSEFRRARLRLRFHNAIAGQECRVTFNDAPLEILADLPVGTLTRAYALALRPGAQNRFAIAFARHNGAGAELAPADPRPLAGTFFGLDLDFSDD